MEACKKEILSTLDLVVGDDLILFSSVTKLGKDKVLEKYDSISNVAHWLVDNGFAKTYNGGVTQKISMCCKGESKSAYKHKWKIVE